MKATDSRVRRHAQMGADMKEVLLSGEKQGIGTAQSHARYETMETA